MFLLNLFLVIFLITLGLENKGYAQDSKINLSPKNISSKKVEIKPQHEISKQNSSDINISNNSSTQQNKGQSNKLSSENLTKNSEIPVVKSDKSQIKKPEATQSKNTKTSSKTIENIPSRQVLQNGFADLAEELLPTVVNITSSQEPKNNNFLEDNLIEDFPKTPLFEDLKKHLEQQLRGPNQIKRKLSSIGSGFIISKDGLIVTNHHVIDDASEINVNLHDGTKYKAKVIGVDKKTDIALLKINPSKELKYATLGDSSLARIGEWVIVIGNPYGLGGSVSVGIVSARGRDLSNSQSDEFIQTDAAINKGNSGGPMFNAKGEVIGIATAIFSPSGGSVGIGFATPSNTALQVVNQLRDIGEVTRGWIGVSVQDVNDEIAESMKLESSKGAFVVDVVKDGPADRAGILPTDIILKFEDQDIEDMKFLPRVVSKFAIGKVAKIQILRQGKIKNFKVTIEKLKEVDLPKKNDNKNIDKKINTKPSGQLIGLSLAEFKTKIRKDKNEINIEGLLVIEVNPKSESAEKGIQIGDVILSANQVPLKKIDDLKEIVDEANKGNKKIFLFIRRAESSYPAVITLK